MKKLMYFIIFTNIFSSFAFAKNCSIGKSCGDTCINVNETCHVDSEGGGGGGSSTAGIILGILGVGFLLNYMKSNNDNQNKYNFSHSHNDFFVLPLLNQDSNEVRFIYRY